MMKKQFIHLVTGFLILFAHPMLLAQGGMTIKEVYNQGVKAMNSGDVDTAKASFESILRKNPNHGDTIVMLHNLKQNEGKIRVNNKKKKFESIQLKEFAVDGATLSESLQLLQKLVEEESKGEVIPNFVIKDPQKKFEEKEISLNLKGIPSGVVFNYVLEMIGAKAAHGSYGITVSPR